MLPSFLQAGHSHRKQGQAGLLLQHWPGVCCASSSHISLAKETAGWHKALSSTRVVFLQCARLLLVSLYLFYGCVLGTEKPQRLKTSAIQG